MSDVSTHHSLAALEAEAIRLARGPSIASAVPDEREIDRSVARQRLLRLQKESGLSQREFAQNLLACDESAMRLVSKGAGLPLPWWLERLLRERPELVASFAATLLADVRVSIARRAANG